MSKLDKYGSGVKARATEWKMPEIGTQMKETRRHVEPIFDASGTLKRHALSRLEAAADDENDAAEPDNGK